MDSWYVQLVPGLFLLAIMIMFFSNLLQQSPKQPEEKPPTQQDKIRAFNSIVSILAQIQQGAPFKDNEIPSPKPADSHERLQLKLSNAFAHLAITNTEVAAATLHTPGRLFVLTWMQDQGKDPDYQDKREDAQVPQNPLVLFWEKLCLILATNTNISDLKPDSGYHPRIVGVVPPPGYPTASDDSRTNLLDYLDQFPKKW